MLESRSLAEIRDALLPKLVSGELRVNGLGPEWEQVASTVGGDMKPNR